MKTVKIFIASSSELKEDRDQFRLFISKENDRLHSKGIYLELVQWENFLDSISNTRLQDEYNKAIRECDIVLCLFFTKVGKYSSEEFDIAYQVFKETGKPKIWTYFKSGQINTNAITNEINTLLDFKNKISNLGHFFSNYTTIDNLINQYRSQLDKHLEQIEDNFSQPNTVLSKGNSISITKEPIKNVFNELLSKQLIEAIKPYNNKARDFLTINANWESNVDLKPIVKRIIISSYVGVLGVQLRKLMSIGEENFSEGKMKRYLENCLITSKRGIQLICYALISKLWDNKIDKTLKLSQSQTNSLIKFFKNAAEDNLIGYTELLKSLIEIFNENNLELPFSQLKDIHPKLNSDSDFIKSILNLENILQLLDKNSFNQDDCINAEKNLTTVLENLNFLVQYKMISLKDINYTLQRNDNEGQYLHNYTLFEGDTQTNNNNQGKVKNENSPVMSFSVLLCKENLQQNINLAPFIIDYNALGLAGGSKICMFSFCNTYDDLSLNYSFIEDNTKVTIKKSKNEKPSEKDVNALNIWLANVENRIDMNYDKMFNLFQEAKKTLVGLDDIANSDSF